MRWRLLARRLRRMFEMEDDEENTKETLESEDVGTPVKMYEHERSF